MLVANVRPLCLVLSWTSKVMAHSWIGRANAKNLNGWTPLHYCTYHGREVVGGTLLGHGADAFVDGVLGHDTWDKLVECKSGKLSGRYVKATFISYSNPKGCIVKLGRSRSGAEDPTRLSALVSTFSEHTNLEAIQLITPFVLFSWIQQNLLQLLFGTLEVQDSLHPASVKV